MWLVYQALVFVLLVVVAPWLLLTRGRHYGQTVRGRLGLATGDGLPGDTESPLWIHAVSVGEVAVAATLRTALPPELSLLVTTVTPTGQERARAAFPSAKVAYLPLELGFALNRFFKRYRPRLLILAEGDLWPLALRRAKRAGAPILVVNGRVSERSYRRMKRLRGLLRPILGPVDHFAVQTDGDRDRLLSLGVDSSRITTTGNLKFDTPEPAVSEEVTRVLDRCAEGRPVLVAGSTMDREEESVLEAFRQAGGGDAALLVLAPRHPERWSAVEALTQRSGFAIRRRSHIALDTEPQAPAERIDVVLLDTLGELAGLYRRASGAFVGGTLVPTGGHNPLEPARFGTPVAAGPSMTNFSEIAEAFDSEHAWRRVEDAADLAATWRGWLEDPDEARRLGERGASVVRDHRGAVSRTLDVLEPYLKEAGIVLENRVA